MLYESLLLELSYSGGFFLTCEGLGLFFFSFLFFFEVEINLRVLTPLFRPESVHSGSASQEDCDHMFPDELNVSSFPDRFPHHAWTAT